MNKNKRKILVVDDSEMNRAILTDILGDEYEIIEACNGAEAVNRIRSYGVELSLVLLDIVMPRMDGFAVLAMMNSYKWIQDIPVIMISAESASDYISKAYDLGATDYIQRPFDSAVVHHRVTNAIMLYAKNKQLVGLVEEQIYEKQKEQSLLINILSNLIELKNGENGSRSLRIYTVTEVLLQNLIKMSDKYKLDSKEVSLIATASALYDIGKIAIDGKILSKREDRLTPEEHEILKQHTVYGAEMLERIPSHKKEPLLRAAKEICRWHHERFDGKGYPDGLKGDDIPISAQVVALAEAYDSLTNDRDFDRCLSHQQAIDKIANGECGEFNPVLIKTLIWSSDLIRSNLRVLSVNGRIHKDIVRVTREAISHRGLTASQRTLDMLESLRDKYNFIASLSDGILFEYYRDPVMISFVNGGAEKLGVDSTVTDPVRDGKMLGCFGEEALAELIEAFGSATPENPKIAYECAVTVNGKKRPCRVEALAQFTVNGAAGPYEFESAIGKITETAADGSLKIKSLYKNGGVK